MIDRHARPAAITPRFCKAGAPTLALVLAASGATAAPAQTATHGEALAVEEVVVTGTRTPRTRRDAPVRTDVVGYQVLQYAAPRNLADALDYLPGARTENNCQNCNTTEIQLLGLPGAYNQILFDGLPMMSGVAAVYGVEQVPAVLIDRIEVVKGGASALYGPGAVAGVVNVVPWRPRRSGLRGSIAHDSPDGASAWLGSLAASWLRDDDGAMATAYIQAEDSPAVDLNGDGFSELARRDLLIAGMRGDWSLDAATRLDVNYQYVAEDRRGGDRLDLPPHEAHIAEALDSRIHRGSLGLARSLDAGTLLAGVVSFARVDRASFYGGLGEVETDPAAPGYDAAALAEARAAARDQYGVTRDDLLFIEARFETTRGAHALIGGLQYRRETIDDHNVDADGVWLRSLNHGTFDNLGAFVQDEWTLRQGLRALLGVRVDKSSELDDPVISPRIGLWWSPSEAWVWRANISTGFRAPELFSEDVHIDTLGAAPVRIRNAAGLGEEKARSVSLGFDWRPQWNDAAVTVDGQAYLTDLSDAFVLSEIREDVDGSLYQIRSNAGGSRVMGAELNLTWRVSERFQLLGGGAWLDARYDTPQVVFDDEAGRVITTRDYLKSPRWSAVGQVLWRMAPEWDAYLAVRHVGTMKALNNNVGALNDTPSFFVADLSLTRHVHSGEAREIDVTFGVRNLFDERQKDLESGAGRDSDYVYGPRSPRSLFVRLNADF